MATGNSGEQEMEGKSNGLKCSNLRHVRGSWQCGTPR